MSAEERVYRGIRQLEPDRVPTELGRTPSVTRKLSQPTGHLVLELAIRLGKALQGTELRSHTGAARSIASGSS